MAAESIGGSPVTVKYGFGRQEIETEQSGNYLFQQPGSSLTAMDLQMLHRDTDFYLVEALSGIPLGRGIMIRPGVTYVRGDADVNIKFYDSTTAIVSLGLAWQF